MLPTPGQDKQPQFAYVIPLEKFVTRRGATWNLSEPLGRDGIKHYLIASGVHPAEVKVTLETYTYLMVHGADMWPGHPPLYTDHYGHEYLNLWVAPTLVPAPAPYPRIETMLRWITSGDTEGERWLRQWMAAKVQNPTCVPKVAIVLATKPGAGKGTLAFLLRHMLGEENCATIKSAELGNRFNGRWIGKLFVLADEVMTSDNIEDISDMLKVLIDGAEIELERKGKDQRAIRNRLAWMFASNDDISPVKLERSDRRYSVFSNHSFLTPEYDALLKSCFRQEDRSKPTPEFLVEMGGFYHDLLNLKVDHAFITRPFGNRSRDLLIEASLPSHQMFAQYVDENGIDDLLDEVLDRDHRGSLVQHRPQWDFGEQGLSTQMLYQCYVEYCKRSGARPLKINRLGVALQHHIPSWPPVRNLAPGTGRQVNCYIVPRTPKAGTPNGLDTGSIPNPSERDSEARSQ